MRLHRELWAAALLIWLHVANTLADDPPEPRAAVKTSSDLSSAFSPDEWLQVERSIDRGLEWLASQQADDGSFPTNQVGQPAVTSLAVMAFLSRGYLPGRGRYGRQIDRAIDYVLAQQNRRGYFSALPVSPAVGHLQPPQTVHYNHAIAGLMLGEVYGMTSGAQSRRIQAALSSALAYSRSIQLLPKAHPDEAGGWRYVYQTTGAGGANADISVTGWTLMFYRSARNAEFDVPKQYFDEGLDFVERCYVSNPAERQEGVFRYRPVSVQGDAWATVANTASAMLVLSLGGRHESEMVRESAAWFASRNYPDAQLGYFYLASYYSGQAMAQVGGDVWNRVFPQIAARLQKEQTPNGAWPPGRGNESSFGSTYATALAILALTPPYQLLPIYQR